MPFDSAPTHQFGVDCLSAKSRAHFLVRTERFPVEI